MAINIAPGYTDTPIVDVPSIDLALPTLNYEADFKLHESVPGRVSLKNVTCPVDQPEVLTIAQRNVANVYAGTSIDAGAYLPTRQGTATLVELREVWVETSTTDDSHRRLIPVRVAVQLTVPSHGAITADMVEALAHRCVSGLYLAGDDTSAGIAAIQRGILAK